MTGSRLTILSGPLLGVLAAIFTVGVAHHGKAQENSSGTPNHDPIDLVNAISIWRKVTAEKNLSASVANAVEKTLTQTLRDRPVAIHLLPGYALESSLGALVDAQQLRYLRDARDAADTGYWLAFCLLDATARGQQPQAVNPQDLREHHEQFIDRLVDRMEAGLRTDATEEELRQVEGSFARTMQPLRATLKQRIGTLRDDVLFPAFKTPFSEQQQQAILRQYDNPALYAGVFNQPMRQEQGNDPYLADRLNAWARRITPAFLYAATTAPLESPLLEFAEARGLSPGLQDSGSGWPIKVRFSAISGQVPQTAPAPVSVDQDGLP